MGENGRRRVFSSEEDEEVVPGGDEVAVEEVAWLSWGGGLAVDGGAVGAVQVGDEVVALGLGDGEVALAEVGVRGEGEAAGGGAAD